MSASDEENDDFGDLDAELDALDVDNDFSLWTSFRSRKSIATSSGTLDLDEHVVASNNDDDTSVPNPLELDDLEYWRTRIMRDEVYSPKYKPSPAEEQEFKELLKYLGMERKKLFEKQDVKWNELSALTNIVLKKGPVLCQGQERELILLTNGFVLAQVEESNKNALARLISRSYEQCDLYNAIQHIRSVPVVVDVIVEVEDEDENVTHEAVELEMEAGQVVVKEQVVNEVVEPAVNGNDDCGNVSASDDESKASECSVEAPVVGHSGDDPTKEMDAIDVDIQESTSTDDEESVASGEGANSENEADDATEEPTETPAMSNMDGAKDRDSSDDDDCTDDEQMKEPSEEEASLTKDNVDGDDDSKSEQDEEDDDNVSDDEESKQSIQENDSNESAEEKKESPAEEAPVSPRQFFGGLFAGGKKLTPEEQDADSNNGSSEDKKQDATDTKSDESVDNEKEAAQEEAPLSPGASFFGLFGAKKNADKDNDDSSPTAASDKTSETTPEKHVKIQEPPKMKQVIVPEERFVFVIKTEDTDEFYLECATKDHKEAWLEALERVLVKTRSRVRSKQDRIRGWQHALVQTSLHSAAVTGLDDLCCPEWLDKVNELDKYNHLAPLHYATMLNMMHIMDWLLRNGADPEVKDEDERTPMYYAQRDGLMGAQSLLLDYGAKRSHLCDVEERGVLFQGAAQVAEAKAAKSAMNGRNKQDTEASPESTLKSHHAAATNAHGAMNDAMNELRIRGEKINDLAEKSNALEENVNTYGDLAKQMKARAKKKKWYNLK